MTEIELLTEILDKLGHIHISLACGVMCIMFGMVAIYCRILRRG